MRFDEFVFRGTALEGKYVWQAITAKASSPRKHCQRMSQNAGDSSLSTVRFMPLLMAKAVMVIPAAIVARPT